MKHKKKSHRSGLLDSLRGFTVLQMVLFHGIWDLVYIFGADWQWYRGTGAYVWQQCICCTFILLSGFCSGMSRHPVRRGLTVFGIGAAVTLVTAVFLPEDIVIFGVLTLLGTCMLLMAVLRRWLCKVPAWLGLPVSLLLFALTRHVDLGYLGIFRLPLLRLPSVLYRNYLTAFFGFSQPGFYSTDYFPLFPWLFWFLAGFFLYRLCGRRILAVRWKGVSVLNLIGRHALEIYTVHQPLLYGLFAAFDFLLTHM